MWRYTTSYLLSLISRPLAKELVEAVQEIQSSLPEMDLYVYGDHTGADMKALDPIIDNALDDPVILGLRQHTRVNDPACFVFTSGTTGIFFNYWV